MIVNFAQVHHDPRQKLPNSGFSNSKKSLVGVNYESWFIFEKLQFMNHIWLTHMQDAYIMTQNFMAIFLPTNFFPTPPTQIFKYRFSLKCVGVIFFRPHIRIQYKILHRIICISMGLSVMRLRKGGFF